MRVDRSAIGVISRRLQCVCVYVYTCVQMVHGLQVVQAPLAIHWLQDLQVLPK